MASNRDRLLQRFAAKNREPFGPLGGSAGERIQGRRATRKAAPYEQEWRRSEPLQPKLREKRIRRA